MIEGHASTYFDDWVSFPFVPGHEVVGELDDGTPRRARTSARPRGTRLPPPFDGAAPGDGDDYAHLATGALEPGIQTGFCCSTGGGWSPVLVAHDSQLHPIGDDVPDERAVLIEPLAAGIHAALMAAATPSVATADAPLVAVLGAGTMGLAATAGLVRHCPRVRVVVGARYPHQQREARRLGADEVVPSAELPRAVRRLAGCHVIGDQLSSGAHATIDAVGSECLDRRCPAHHPATRPGRADGDAGRGHGRPHRSLAPGDRARRRLHLWHGNTAPTRPTDVRTFSLALETADAIEAERWLSATYPLADHVDAIAHAAAAGRRGAIKVAFEPQARSR